MLSLILNLFDWKKKFKTNLAYDLHKANEVHVMQMKNNDYYVNESSSLID